MLLHSRNSSQSTCQSSSGERSDLLSQGSAISGLGHECFQFSTEKNVRGGTERRSCGPDRCPKDFGSSGSLLKRRWSLVPGSEHLLLVKGADNARLPAVRSGVELMKGWSTAARWSREPERNDVEQNLHLSSETASNAAGNSRPCQQVKTLDQRGNERTRTDADPSPSDDIL